MKYESLLLKYGITWHRSSQFDGVDNRIFTNSLLERGASSDFSILYKRSKARVVESLQGNLCFQHLPQHKLSDSISDQATKKTWILKKPGIARSTLSKKLCSDVSFTNFKLYKKIFLSSLALLTTEKFGIFFEVSSWIFKYTSTAKTFLSYWVLQALLKKIKIMSVTNGLFSEMIRTAGWRRESGKTGVHVCFQLRSGTKQ